MSSLLVVTFAFLTECAPQAAVGAMAIENMMRNPAAAVIAVVTPPLTASMGPGWYFTAFALVDLVVFGGGAVGQCLERPRRDLLLTIPTRPCTLWPSEAIKKQRCSGDATRQEGTAGTGAGRRRSVGR